MSLLPLALALPLLLLALVLAMERVERPLRLDAVSDRLEGFLDSATPEEIEVFVSEGFASALKQRSGRGRLARLIPGRGR